jgi:hypothetical protein
LAGSPNQSKINQLRKEITRLATTGNLEQGRIHKDLWDRRLSDLVEQSARDLASEIRQGRGKSQRADSLRSNIVRLRSKFKDPKRANSSGEYYIIASELEPLARTLIEEAIVGRGRGEKALDAKRRFEEVSKEFGIEGTRWLIEAVRGAYDYRDYELVQERSKTILDRDKIARLEAEVARISEALGITPEQFLERVQGWTDDPESSTRRDLILERRKDRPNQELVKQLEERLRQLTAERRPDSYAKDRVSRIAVEVDMDKLQLLTLTPELAARKRNLEEKQRQLRARMGDPLISIDAPKDARQVVAVMPDGITKQLEFNEGSRRWEGRFDIPTYVREGEYVVNVFVVLKEGTRLQKEMKYHVDVTKPAAKAELKWVEGKLRLEVNASVDTDRVEAVLPWGEMINVERTSQPGRFVTIIEAPASFLRKRVEIEIIVTDKAHNRTLLKADSSRP